MRIPTIICSLICVLLGSAFAQDVPAFREQVIIFKLDASHTNISVEALQHHPDFSKVATMLKPVELFRKFPSHRISDPQRTVLPQSLAGIFELKYSATLALPKAIQLINKVGIVEFAEPAYICRPAVVPNDSLLATQWHLPIIKAFEAWDIDTGSADVTIAISDTGIDWDHPDLVDNVQYNTADPLGDTLDNDSNGYINDYRGWNFYDDNNDPNETGFSHGTHVAGLAAASANNAVGIVGSGYSCKIMPLKAGDKLSIPYGYESIVYAADNGADIINCSWGSNAYTAFGESVVRYATEVKGALVVCGAGNRNSDAPFYPAAFEHALAVGATDTLDRRAFFSSYGYWVDIVAPGEYIFSTKNQEVGFYGYDSGTSMASPIVAGCAGLVKSVFPNLGPLQIKQQIIHAVDDIYGIDANKDFADRLGRGRLNMQKALVSLAPAAADIANEYVTDNDDEVYLQGDIVDVGIELVNYLGTLEAGTVTASVLTNNAQLVTSTWDFPELGANARVNNYSTPLQLEVGGGTQYNEKVVVQLEVTAGDYTKRAFVEFVINQDYVNIAVNDVKTTVNSFGLVGYNGESREQGFGFILENLRTSLYEAGLMIGHQNSVRKRVVDRVRGSEPDADRDFWPESIIESVPVVGSEVYRAQGSFIDSSATLDEIGLEVSQTALAWNDDGHRNYVVVEYEVMNISGQDLSDVQIGVFADWDIEDLQRNKGVTVPSRKLGYQFQDANDRISAGIQLLTGQPFNNYFIDNEPGGLGGVDIYDADGYSSADKYLTLTTNRFEGGVEGNGNDVIQVISTTGVELPAGSSERVAFAFMAARTPEELIQVADSAFVRYNGFGIGEDISLPFRLKSIAPNPNQGSFVLDFYIETSQAITFTVVNTLGMPVQQLGTYQFLNGLNQKRFELSEMESGMYSLVVAGANFRKVIKFQYLQP